MYIRTYICIYIYVYIFTCRTARIVYVYTDIYMYIYTYTLYIYMEREMCVYTIYTNNYMCVYRYRKIDCDRRKGPMKSSVPLPHLPHLRQVGQVGQVLQVGPVGYRPAFPTHSKKTCIHVYTRHTHIFIRMLYMRLYLYIFAYTRA